MRERVIEEYLHTRITEIDGKCLKWCSPQNAGVPDRIVLFKNKIYFVELKAPKMKLSKIQTHFKLILEKHGQDFRMIDTKGGVDAFIFEIAGRED